MKDSPLGIAGKVLASAIGEHPKTVPLFLERRRVPGCNRRFKRQGWLSIHLRDVACVVSMDKNITSSWVDGHLTLNGVED
jgi:hypothetical protein